VSWEGFRFPDSNAFVFGIIVLMFPEFIVLVLMLPEFIVLVLLAVLLLAAFAVIAVLLCCGGCFTGEVVLELPDEDGFWGLFQFFMRENCD
jgi:hypothetical protein